MTYLPMANKVVLGDAPPPDFISAEGKHVVILGGGDTGSDCLGTSNRQGALSVHQFELLPEPPGARTLDMPWPYWPMILRSSSSHEEGVIRDWSINTKSFSGEHGTVKKLHAVRLEWKQGNNGRPQMVNGAHVLSFNAGNVGVVLLGDFTDQVPTPAARRSLVAVNARAAPG